MFFRAGLMNYIIICTISLTDFVVKIDKLQYAVSGGLIRCKHICRTHTPVSICYFST